METKRFMKVWGFGVAMIALLLLSATASHAATLYDGALSYWTMDDNAPNTTVADYKNANAGTFYDTTNPNTSAHHVSGKVGGALSFDGINDKITTAVDVDLTNFSLSAWVKFDSMDIAKQYWIVGRGYSYCIGKIANANKFFVYDGTVVQTSNAITATDQWYHVVGTSNGTSLSLYVNGVFDKSIGGANTGKNDNKISFGSGGAAQYLNGSIDEVAVWNSALSANEIDALYKVGFVSSAMNTSWSLGYSTDEINQLSELYYEGKYGSGNPDPVVVDGTTWQYFATLPEQDGKTLGQAYTVNGKKYIYLGSGIGEPLGGGVPEPSSMAVTGLALGLLGLMKKIRRKKNVV